MRGRRQRAVSSGTAHAVKVVDVSDFQAIRTAVHDIVAEVGRVDVLINNAGVEMRASFLGSVQMIGSVRWMSTYQPTPDSLRASRSWSMAARSRQEPTWLRSIGGEKSAAKST